MQHSQDYTRYAILYVDDEIMALKYFEKTFGTEFRVITAESAEEGMKFVQARGEDIGVLLTDQRMPGQKGVQLLQQALKLRPRMVRMLITAYADYGVTVDAVNLGNIFRYVSKPIQVEDMRNTLRRALEFYAVQRERDDLLMEKLSVLQQMIIADRVISLGVLAAGLSRTLQNSLLAVRAFLNLAPDKPTGADADLARVRDSAFWERLHSRVLDQSAGIGRLIAQEDADCPASTGHDVETDLAAAIQAAARDKAAGFRARGVLLELELASELPTVRTNPPRFQRMLDLLLDGELASLPAGGRVVLRARADASDGRPPRITIEICDDGPGIPQQALRAVFDPFAGESGGDESRFALGLLTAYFLVHDLGGQIAVRNAEGGGMSILIQLPVQRTPPESPEGGSRDFVKQVLVNDILWERLLADR